MAEQLPAVTTHHAAWIDRLRVAVIAVVIAFHAATTYLIPIDWHYEERTAPELVGMLLLLPLAPLALFGLGPLFLIGGMMAASSLARRGTASFVRSRLARLGIPSVVFLLVIDPVADYLGHHAEGGPRTLRYFFTDLVGDRDFGVFWFVVALLAFSLGYAAWRRLRPPHGEAGGALSEGMVAWTGLATTVGALLVWTWRDVLDPTFWALRWGQWPQSAALFALGALLAERDLRIPDQLARRLRTLALLGVLAFLPIVGFGITETPAGAPTLKPWAVVVLAPVVGLVSPSVTIWLTHAVQRRWEMHSLSPMLTRAARGSYAAYLLHPLVLVGLGVAARPLPLPAEVKFVLVAALGVTLAFASGYAVTRLPVARRIL
jgi:glucans biosynthesis protein C